MTQIDPELSRIFQAHHGDPDFRLAVIVTMEPGAHSDALVAAGMSVSMATRHGSIASGTIDATALNRLTRHESVIRIERDGEVRALKP